MTDPFANAQPEEFQAPKLPALKTKKRNDWFDGVITRVGAIVHGEDMNGKPQESYPLDILTQHINLTTIPEDEAFPYTPPPAGEEATLWVVIGSNLDKAINLALRKVKANGLNVGDYLAVKVLELKKGKFPQPAKIHGAIVRPAEKTEEDPWDGGSQAPF